MRLGLEIEGVYNEGIIDIEIGSYHSGTPITFEWKAERDGSLRTSGDFEMESTVEFVSGIFNGKKELTKGLQQLQRKLCTKDTKELNKLLYFNSSTGAHVHFSLNNDYNFQNSCSYTCFEKARKYFFKILKQSDIIPTATKALIKNQYSRAYSRVNEGEAIRDLHTRYSEWNFCSERNGQGMEWRSFNLVGIKSWKELKEMYNLAYKTLKYLEKTLGKWSETIEPIEDDMPIDKSGKRKKKKLKTRVVLDKKTEEIEECVTLISR